MAALNAKRRNALPKSKFAIPETRDYPIDTRDRARSALARVKANGTPAEQKQVANAVAKAYPDMDVQAATNRRKYARAGAAAMKAKRGN